ncbi:MAG: ABC transporter substrate-binding protein [Deltaproteobacteria bacterium]|nr:ABC transporter substrate-binding protein [Deltaproteobacteria bacterium]
MRGRKDGFWFGVVCILVCFILFPPAAHAGPKYGGTLRIAVRIPQYNRLDGLQLTTEGMVPSATMIYEGLYVPGRKGGAFPVPALATGYETKDNKVWIFHLRKGVKFHNGREMTAEDVKANFDWRIKTPKGWKPVKYRQQLSCLEKVEVLDRYTVKVTLSRPFSPLIGVFTWAMRAIVPPEEVEKWGKEFTLHPCGTGPYKIQEIKPKEKVVLVRNEEYWGPKPYIDRVEYYFMRSNDARMVALEKGEVDFAMLYDQSRPVLKKNPKIQWEPVIQSMAIHKLYFNMRRWPMSDVRFRKAVWMGADWKNIVINAFPFKSGKPLRSLLDYTPYFSPEAEKYMLSYNPKEAKRLIKEVEKDAGKKIPPIYYLDSSATTMKSIGEMAKMQLAQVGVPLNLQLMSHAIWFDKLLRDPKMEWDMGGYGQGFSRSPTVGLGTFRSNAGEAPDGKSIGGYANPKFDALVTKAERSMSLEERKKIWTEMEKILLKDAVCVPLFPFHVIHAWHKDRVKGVINTDTGSVNVTTCWGANMWLEE